MGAETFYVRSKGKTAQAAFDAAVKDAQYEHGHGGYSGTIAEKGSFVMIPCTATDPKEIFMLAEKLVDDGDSRIDDKWGPAGCLPLGKGEWLFFGWASS